MAKLSALKSGKTPALSLEKILFSQGFGSRRYCREVIESGGVKINDEIKQTPEEIFLTEKLVMNIEGEAWEYREKAYLIMNKPAGVECSQNPTHHPSIYTLLPAPLIQRGVQCVGRLDQDTTGLILLSDDGQFIHSLTSPKKQVSKVYEVTTESDIAETQIQHLLTGVLLRHEVEPCIALSCIKTSSRTLTLTITEGRYHQVKRMIAAVGNSVKSLHRSAIGEYVLPADLGEGQWRWLCWPLAQRI